jgi:hypothetical protein
MGLDLKYHPFWLIQEELKSFEEKIEGLPPKARRQAKNLLTALKTNELGIKACGLNLGCLKKRCHRRGLLLAKLYDLCDTWAN